MNDFGQTICLCMIVKNEASVIKRSLDSIRGTIDYWVIVDTGSTDGTQSIIRETMGDIPGDLHERPWKDFAHNRSEALALARQRGDYSLVIDADDILEAPENFSIPQLTEDCYELRIIDGYQHYPRIQLFNNRLSWVYRGVVHEFPDTAGTKSVGRLPLVIRRGHDGARRKNREVFLQDAATIHAALKTERDLNLRNRYVFYLAQSYRDAREPLEAIRYYLERACLGGWEEEVFYSLYQVAKIKEQQGFPEEEVISAYELAHQATTNRVESLYSASRFCRIKQLYEQGYLYAQQGLGRTFPPESLFGEPWVYETGLLDEFAVNAYWTGRYAESIDACLQVLGTGGLEKSEFNRILNNARHSLKELVSTFELSTKASNN